MAKYTIIKRVYRFLRHEVLCVWHLTTRGFDNEDLWNLDHTIAVWLLPRLREFKKQTIGIPSNLCIDSDGNDVDLEEASTKWDSILNDIEFALESIANEWEKDIPEEDWERVDKGCKLLGEYFRALWW